MSVSFQRAEVDKLIVWLKFWIITNVSPGRFCIEVP